MNDQEIFTHEEWDENIKRKHELIKLVASGEAVLIVGAGSSARVGYPSWSYLLKELEGLAGTWGDDFQQNYQMREENPLEYAECIKSYICDKTGNLDRYYDFLYELFQRKNPSYDKFHRMLVELPVRGILTTNYDTVLTEALSEVERHKKRDSSYNYASPLVIGKDPPRLIYEFLLARNNDLQIQRRIAHLHGTYENPNSIILSSKDYQTAYGLVDYEDISKQEDYKEDGLEPPGTNQVQESSEWTLHRKLLWAVLATRRVIFIGFSMKDPYLNKMLETVSADLWGWNKSIHFAIMSISLESANESKVNAIKFNRKYGVGTIFYEDSNISHKGLYDIITEIAKECNIDIKSDDDLYEDEQQISNVRNCLKTPSGLVRRSFARARSTLGIFRQLFTKSQNELDWLEESNQRMEKRISDEN